MTKDPSCHTRVIKDLVREHIPGAETISNVSGELAMSLPTEDETMLPDLLKALSSRKSEIGVDNFGLSITTLEDVFLKVGRAEQDEDMEFEEEAANNNNNNVEEEADKRDFMRMASVDSNCYDEGGIRADNFRAGYAKGAK